MKSQTLPTTSYSNQIHSKAIKPQLIQSPSIQKSMLISQIDFMATVAMIGSIREKAIVMSLMLELDRILNQHSKLYTG